MGRREERVRPPGFLKRMLGFSHFELRLLDVQASDPAAVAVHHRSEPFPGARKVDLCALNPELLARFQRRSPFDP